MTQAWRLFGELVPRAVAGSLIAAPAIALLARRRARRRGETWAAAALTIAVRAAALGAGALVLSVTLQPIGAIGTVSTTANWLPLATISAQLTSQVDASIAVTNVAFNVLLFVPVGFTWTLLAGQWGRTWGAALIAGAGLSVLIEVTQLLVPFGRVVDIDDVLLNALGVLVGALMARGVTQAVGRVRGRAAAPS